MIEFGAFGLNWRGAAVALAFAFPFAPAFAAQTDPPPMSAQKMGTEAVSAAVGIDGEQISCFIGGNRGNEYLDAESIAAKFRGRTEYRLYNLSGALGEALAPGPPVDEGSEGECAALWRHEIALAPASAGTFMVALHLPDSDRDPLPKVLEVVETPNPAHIELVRDFLIRRNVATPEVKIVQSIRTDFDGDGREDWILNAVNHNPDIARKGDYSIVLVVRGLGEGERTYIVQDEINLEDSPYPSTLWENRIVAVLDVDGDGTSEIILNGVYIYGGGWELIRFEEGSFEHTLFCGCDG